MEHVCIRVEVVFDVLKHYQYLFFPSKYMYSLLFIVQEKFKSLK